MDLEQQREVERALGLTRCEHVANNDPTIRCPEEAVARVEIICVHEHVLTSLACQRCVDVTREILTWGVGSCSRCPRVPPTRLELRSLKVYPLAAHA